MEKTHFYQNSLWHRTIAWLIAGFYYKRIRTQYAEGAAHSSKPTLILASHRNGAMDGYVLNRVFPCAPFLVSAQLLRSIFLRVLFAGIAVVRKKDQTRYGMRKSDYPDPVDAAVEQIANGGSVVLMPEGSSEWQHKPLPYRKGFVQIVKALHARGCDFAVQPVGTFYRNPAGFRSEVEVLLGTAITPSPDVSDAALFKQLSQALEAVSVCCESEAHFNAAQSHAHAVVTSGKRVGSRTSSNNSASYSQAFLEVQRKPELGASGVSAVSAEDVQSISVWGRVVSAVRYFFAAFFYVVCAPVVLVALAGQRLADGLNNIAFFRVLFGFYAAVLYLGVVAVFIVYCLYAGSPSWLHADYVVWAAVVCALALLGWWLHPSPVPHVLQTTSQSTDEYQD